MGPLRCDGMAALPGLLSTFVVFITTLARSRIAWPSVGKPSPIPAETHYRSFLNLHSQKLVVSGFLVVGLIIPVLRLVVDPADGHVSHACRRCYSASTNSKNAQEAIRKQQLREREISLTQDRSHGTPS